MTASSLFRLAAIGALAISFSLSACGRRGALDPPPRASAQPTTQQPQQGPTEDEHGLPSQPKGEKKPFLLDWLLN